MTKDLAMFLGIVAGLTGGQYMQSFDEMMNDPIFQMMCEEDKYDSEGVEETSNS